LSLHSEFTGSYKKRGRLEEQMKLSTYLACLWPWPQWT